MSGHAVHWGGVLDRLLAGEDLDEERAAAVMGAMMRGEAEDSQVAGLLVALRAKGEAPSEIAGFVRAMMDEAEPIAIEGSLVDTCGTGGSGGSTFNVSTIAALVVAAAGQPVAKHGNRAVSGSCGSADLVEAFGVPLDLTPDQVAASVGEVGIGFLFARLFHPAMRHVGPVRVQLGVRTVFNVLGPLSNPAGVAHQVVGVPDARLAGVMADALGRLGKRHALVVRGDDGMDELTTTGPSRVWEVRDGEVRELGVDPLDLGIERARPEQLTGGDVGTNLGIAESVLQGEPGPRADLVALNAAAALYAADRVDSLAAGLDVARQVMADGAGLRLRDAWVSRSRRLEAGDP